jgi:hypothetical protein
MACRTLLRRKTQMDLLATACEQRVAARLTLRGRTAVSGTVALTALERDGVQATWIEQPVSVAELNGRPVQVRFEHGGEHYVFRAVVREGSSLSTSQEEEMTRLKLSLPVRLEHARHRRHIRLTSPDLPAIESTFTHVVDERRRFHARVTDIGDGGIGVRARAADVSQLYTGDLFWVGIKLPGEATRAEMVVRLVHLRPIKRTDELAMGCVFQPTDDLAHHENYLRWLEAFIAHRQGPER